MKGYTTKEVAEALGLPTSRILAWTRSGLIEPVRGPRGAHVYSFQDLVLLRTARGLDAQRFAEEFGGPPRRFHGEAIDELVAVGLLAEAAGGGDLCLTPRGRLLSDSVFERFV